MGLLQSWKESLAFFKPKNFKLFFLVTLKAIGYAYTVWLKHFWWLFFVIVLFDPHVWVIFGVTLGTLAYAVLYSLHMFIFSLLVFTLFLSVRSSVRKKTFAYFWEYKCHFFGVVGAIILLFLSGLFFTVLWVLLPVMYFYILFVLDARCTVRDLLLSLKRGLIMAMFNLPFCFVLLFFKSALSFEWIIAFGYPKLAIGIFYYNIFVLPVFISFMTNFYIKRLHDQFKLYCPDVQ